MGKRKFHRCILISVFSAVLTAPAYMLTKIVTNTQLDDMSFMAIRYGLIVVVCLPLVIKYFGKIAKNLRLVLACNVFLMIAGIVHTPAISSSTSSYVAIMHLFSPITFVLLSATLIREKLNTRKIIGITVAFIGAFVMFALPAITADGTFQFYPEATILSFINGVCFGIVMIMWRKINLSGVPIWATMGSTFILLAVTTGVVSVISNGGVETPLSIVLANPAIPITIAFLSIVVSLISHIMNTEVYEKVGSTVVAATSYLGKILGIILPIVILRESLSVHLIGGAIITIIGIVIIDTKPKRREHIAEVVPFH
ncbi:EamA family transporter [Candidatus Saccharibacteria bacterium]|nr:EamA family transporter [Candidatus Saccharibacteria bacterium]MCL1962982.1 EamA family transporter [Candidatus Saccharibacteria bacterium]